MTIEEFKTLLLAIPRWECCDVWGMERADITGEFVRLADVKALVEKLLDQPARLDNTT